jgi:hypothetical protein
MWFLIKTGLAFSLLLVLLSFFGPKDASEPQAAAGTGVDIGDTVSAATQAIGYFSAICLEKPDVCVKGAETFNALGHRAKDGARIAYQLLEAQFGDTDTKSASATLPAKPGALAHDGDGVTTGTVPATGAAAQPLPPRAVQRDRSQADATTTPAMNEVLPAAPQDLGVSRIPVPEKRIAPRLRESS